MLSAVLVLFGVISYGRIGMDRYPCLLYPSDAADERSSVDFGGRRIINKKTTVDIRERRPI